MEMDIDFTLTLNNKQVSGRGQVVRVEQGVAGSATGVALRITNSGDLRQIL